MPINPLTLPAIVDSHIGIPQNRLEYSNGQVGAIHLTDLNGNDQRLLVRPIDHPKEYAHPLRSGEALIYVRNQGSTIPVAISLEDLNRCLLEDFHSFKKDANLLDASLTKRLLTHEWRMQSKTLTVSKLSPFTDAQIDQIRKVAQVNVAEIEKLWDQLQEEAKKFGAKVHRLSSEKTGLSADVTLVRGESKVQEFWVQGNYLNRGAYKEAYRALHVRLSQEKPALETVVELIVKSDIQGAYKEIETMHRLKKCAHLVSAPLHSYGIPIPQSQGVNVGILMPLYAGSVADVLGKHHMRPREEFKAKAAILSDAAQGLLEMHQKGYLHCDLKPGNIFVRKSADKEHPWNGYLADLGLSIRAKAPISTLNGTPLYMDPEVYFKKKNTQSSDMWSFGLTLHQIFYGTLDPKGKDDDLAQFINRAESNCRNRTQFFYLLRSATAAEKLDGLFPRDYFSEDAQLRPAEEALREVITGLLVNSPETRLTSEQVVEKLKAVIALLPKSI